MFQASKQGRRKMKVKDEVVKKVSDYHLVIRIQDRRISFFAYKDTHHLYHSFSEEQIKKMTLFDNIEELYEYLKQQSPSILRLQQNNLYCAFAIGKKMKEVKVPLFQTQMPYEKAVKIKLKNASFEFKKLQTQLQQVQTINQSQLQSTNKILQLKANKTKRNRIKQRLIKQSSQRLKLLVSDTKKNQELLKQLEQALVNVQALAKSKNKKTVLNLNNK